MGVVYKIYIFYFVWFLHWMNINTLDTLKLYNWNIKCRKTWTNTFLQDGSFSWLSSLDHLSNGEVGEDPGQGGTGQDPRQDHLLHRLIIQFHPFSCLAEPMAAKVSLYRIDVDKPLASLLDADTIPPSLPVPKLLAIPGERESWERDKKHTKN